MPSLALGELQSVPQQTQDLSAQRRHRVKPRESMASYEFNEFNDPCSQDSHWSI